MLEMDQDEYETEENESQEDQDAWMILPEDQCSTSSVENHQSNEYLFNQTRISSNQLN